MIELVGHSLAFAVRVDDAFTSSPVREELIVSLDTGERPVTAPGGGTRQSDGTYRFIDLPTPPATRQLTVTSPSGSGFTWTAATTVSMPLPDRRQPIVVPMWPTARAAVAGNVIAIRGAVDVGGTALSGQEVRIRPVLTPPPSPPPPIRRTRSDAGGAFLFVVASMTEVDELTGDVPLKVEVPGHAIAAIDVIRGSTITTFTTSTFEVPPGRETSVRFHLS